MRLSLKQFQIKYFLLVIPFFVLTIFIKSLRWFYIIKIQGIRLSLFKSYLYYSASIFWGIITPGRLGEAIKIFYLKSHAVSAGKAALGVLIDRGMDLFFLTVLSVAGIMVILNYFSYTIFAMIILCMIFLLIITYWNKSIIANKIIKFLLFVIPNKYKDKVDLFMNEAKMDLLLFSWPKWIIITILTVLAWTCNIIPLYILGKGLEIMVHPSMLITAIFLSFSISMLPISFNGVGTRDAFLILYLGKAGITEEKAILFSSMFIYMGIVDIFSSYISYTLKDTRC